MSADQENASAPPPSEDSTPPLMEPQTTKLEKPTSTMFSIWPPTQRTRDAVLNRLIETLSTPSVLSKRYGTIPHDEATAAARQIEEEAFAAAGGSASSDDDGIEILQVYSKEISKRMLETVKARASASENGANQTPESNVPAAPATPATEDVSSVEAES